MTRLLEPPVFAVEIKTVDAAGVAFIVKEEGCVLHPYLDSRSIPTIAVGNTFYENFTRVKMTDPPITMARAISMFRFVLSHYEMAVWSVTRDDITQNNFNALVSISYNIGLAAFKNSTLLKRVNKNPHDLGITSSFFAFRFAGGKPVLLSRRVREAVLYFS